MKKTIIMDYFDKNLGKISNYSELEKCFANLEEILKLSNILLSDDEIEGIFHDSSDLFDIFKFFSKNFNISDSFRSSLLKRFYNTYMGIEGEIKQSKSSSYVSEKDSINAYLTEIGRYPLLTKKEEVALAKKIKAGDENAKKMFINCNLRLVVSIAKRFTYSDVPLLDLVQEGNLGLIKALEKFDYTMGYKFSTYATWWIVQGIERFISDTNRNIRIPNYLYEKLNLYKKTVRNLERELGRIPTDEEVANIMNISMKTLLNIKKVMEDTISLNVSVGDDRETELGDLLEDPNENPEEFVVQSSLKGEIEKILESCNFDDREIGILKLRFGFYNDKCFTLEEVGNIYNVTRERVRQIEDKLLKKIRGAKTVKELAYYTKDEDYALANLKELRKRDLEAKYKK